MQQVLSRTVKTRLVVIVLESRLKLLLLDEIFLFIIYNSNSMETYAPNRFSRRKVLSALKGIPPAVIFGLGCGSNGIPDKAPTDKDYESQSEKTKNPIYRAASVEVIVDYGSNSSGIGHGGIFRDGQNLYIMTQQHVVPDKQNKTWCVIPGLSQYRYDLETNWEAFPPSKDEDPNIRQLINGELKARIEYAIDQGILTPLTFYEGEIAVNQELAMCRPNTGELNYISFAYYDQKANNLLVAKLKKGYSCRGFSGLPILEIDKNKHLTSKSIGLLLGKESASDCAKSMVYIKPHGKIT